ncbi:MAG: PilZ domain-containing protein [Deltaproteobacteria bacterium]|nr:PilZ domain-containing protein [Deltaproteobacteria bacterium]MBI3293630.1 PilZ domain-containing protein [Deltaproteobacteria bacterium]
MTEHFKERRKEPRLPYSEKLILTNGDSSRTAYAANVSRGGFFVMSLEPFPLDTVVHLSFFLPHITGSICLKGKVAHIVYDRQRCEVECGMGVMFLELTEAQRAILNTHILNEQRAYTELKTLFDSFPPDPVAVEKCVKAIPALQKYDLLELRYKVNRVYTIFETIPGDPTGGVSGNIPNLMSA